MKLKLIFLFLFTFLIIQTGICQDTGFGMWYGLNTEYSINKKIEIDLQGTVRTYDNGKKVEQVFLEGGITYKFNKYLSVTGSYRFVEKIEKNLEFYARHKLFGSVKGTLPAGNFSFSSRLMLQFQNKTYIEKLSDEIPDYHLRIKLKAVYKIPGKPVNPFLYFESFNPMFDSSSRSIDKERFGAGFELKLTQKQSVELEYIFQRDFVPNLYDLNIISLNYNLKFKGN